jgi:hypothetical protein
LDRPKQVIVLRELDVDHMIDRGRRHGSDLGGCGCVGSRGEGRLNMVEALIVDQLALVP